MCCMYVLSSASNNTDLNRQLGGGGVRGHTGGKQDINGVDNRVKDR
jgi:hypothetical protein